VFIHVPREGAPSLPLNEVLRRAGAVFSVRSERPTVVNYGSAAGELAVCISAVGLVDRSRLREIVLQAPPSELHRITYRLVGGTVVAGGALHAGHAWWCGLSPDCVLVLAEPAIAGRLRERLAGIAVHHATLRTLDVSEEWTAVELIGRRVAGLLAALGVYGPSGDARAVPPFTERKLDGIDTHWLLQSARRALALIPRERAGDWWRGIEQVGRPFGISCVGSEAAGRYELLERARPSALPQG
jgi:hypothetical protein